MEHLARTHPVRRRCHQPAVPLAARVYATPELGLVGLDEATATDRGFAFEVRQADFAPLSEMVSAEDRHILVKLIVKRATGTVPGLHVCGENAAETSELAAALIAGGVSEHDLYRTIALHPTNAEEIIGLGRARRPLDQIIDS